MNIWIFNVRNSGLFVRLREETEYIYIYIYIQINDGSEI